MSLCETWLGCAVRSAFCSRRASLPRCRSWRPLLPRRGKRRGRTAPSGSRPPRRPRPDPAAVVVRLRRALRPPGAQCATAALPLDYDSPTGPTTQVAVLRIRAADPEQKIGTLFLNPGGPGGSGVEIAAAAPTSSAPGPRPVRRRRVRPSRHELCVNVGAGRDAGARPRTSPGSPSPSRAATGVRGGGRSAKAFGTRARRPGGRCRPPCRPRRSPATWTCCAAPSGTRSSTTSASPTAPTWGRSTRTCSPTGCASVVVDGVLDPVGWAGTPRTAACRRRRGSGPAKAADKALHEILARCRKAGPDYCSLAGVGDPQADFDRLVARAKKAPIDRRPARPDERFGLRRPLRRSSRACSTTVLGYADVDAFLSLPSAALSERRRPARRPPVHGRHRIACAQGQARRGPSRPPRRRPAQGLRRVRVPVRQLDRGVRRGPVHGRAQPAERGELAGLRGGEREEGARASARCGRGPSAPCASSTWTAQDEDSLRRPVHPAHRQAGARRRQLLRPGHELRGRRGVARLLPSSRLLSSVSFGHTAYGTSPCLTAR